ncbi:unnamed protein product [Protopolystoma xenopodis]|uniref:Uncharacterized protein n=1 Tax=Protopolystoma xenopodis TaxID=117903 RepID=A0A448X2Q9_9PLAT|nr:unnamed protein product [Protopolystoma xenopodis]
MTVKPFNACRNETIASISSTLPPEATTTFTARPMTIKEPKEASRNSVNDIATCLERLIHPSSPVLDAEANAASLVRRETPDESLLARLVSETSDERYRCPLSSPLLQPAPVLLQPLLAEPKVVPRRVSRGPNELGHITGAESKSGDASTFGLKPMSPLDSTSRIRPEPKILRSEQHELRTGAVSRFEAVAECDFSSGHAELAWISRKQLEVCLAEAEAFVSRHTNCELARFMFCLVKS